MLIEIRKEVFNAWQELASYQQNLGFKGQYGAVASFVGAMRDFNDAEKIRYMTLEHYPGMTEKHLNTIAKEATDTWGLMDAIILHRIGRINIGDDIVLVGTWSAHRKEAFESCRQIMEELKATAPFWKKEETLSGPRWVKKTP